MLTFDPDPHVYRWRGAIVPGVTSLLEGLHSFAHLPPGILEAARERGTNVHSACELYDLEDLDEDDLHRNLPLTWRYLQGWKKFVRECEPNWSLIEQPLYSKGFGFAGTPDRLGTFKRAGVDVGRAVVDIKSGATSHPIWGVQTAAYKELARGMDPLMADARRFTIQLTAEGDYRLLEWIDPFDWPLFVGLTNIHKFKEKHKL